jgi:signal transduction histidine kinase
MSSATAIISSPVSITSRWGRAGLWLAAIALVLAVGYFDYATGYEISAVLFYSIPIFVMVWFGDRISSVFIALCCALVWWWADEAAGHHYTREWHQIWETAMRLAYFLIFVELFSVIKSRIQLLERNQILEQEITRIRENEQQRIGRDLHDDVCQYFAAIGCAMGSLKRSLEQNGVAQAARAREIEDLVMKGVAKTREIARGLLPVEYDNEGLQSALEELAARSTNLMNLRCEFECDSPAPIFDHGCATHLYRIAQESIANASRHGKAQNVVIRLSANPSEVALSVSDDGVGLAVDAPDGRGRGLNIMKYRARMIDANFEVLPRPGGGTIVRCFFPSSS